ncbi:reverse transcriptase domain-containing protein [Tanacetum coccineum]
MMFPLSLTGEAKTWLDELNEGTIETWDELRNAFISRFFLPSLLGRLLREIHAFSQHENESLTDAWLRMKEIVQNCHGHNLSKGNIIKKKYHGLSEITQEVLNTAAGGIFLYKTQNQAYQLLEDKVLLKLDWDKNQKTKLSLKKIVAFANEGNSNSNTDKIMARMGAMTIKIDAQYKELQSRAKQPTYDLDDDDMPINTQPNPRGSKAYQPPQARNEHVNAVFTRSGKSYNPPDNPDDQQNNSKNPINFHSDDEKDEPKPQPKTQPTKPVKEIPLPKPYKPKIPYPQCLKKEKMEAQYGKFLDMFRAVQINVPLVDILARMPNYGKLLKELISNKHKIKQISIAFLSDESSSMIQNKVPPKLRDPGSFFIPCNFNKTFSCNALAGLGASINLMSYSLYAKLSLETLKPTKMNIRLADKSFQYPVGIAKNMLVEVEEDFDALLDEGSKILHSIEGTLLEEEIISEFDKFMAMSADENFESESDIEELPFEKITINTDYKIKTSLEEPPTDLELKPLPDNLEYVFLEEPSFLLVIISSKLSAQNKSKLVSFLKKHKEAFAWKTTDIPGIYPSFCVPKKIGITVVTNKNDELVPTRTVTGWRVCIDYRKLNEATAKDHFPLPFMDQMRMPFGLCNAPATFQRCMLAIFQDMIEEFVEVFMDDFSVFVDSFNKCLNNLDKMLQRCKDAHLVLNWGKCHFMVKEGIVLGHKVSGAGLEVDKAKIDVISKLSPPNNIKDTPFEFNDECQKTFEILKEKLTCAPVIVSPNWNLPFELMCDASDFVFGAVLGQKDGKNFHPIYFASKTLNPAQQKYTVTEKELMVVVFAFNKFRSYLIFSKTIVHTDHSALKHLFKKQDAKPRLIRWILLLQEFDIEIKDRKGTENVAADHLFRIENDESSDDSEVDVNFP